MNSNVLLCLALSGFAKADECKSPARAILKKSFLNLKGSDSDTYFFDDTVGDCSKFPSSRKRNGEKMFGSEKECKEACGKLIKELIKAQTPSPCDENMNCPEPKTCDLDTKTCRIEVCEHYGVGIVPLDGEELVSVSEVPTMAACSNICSNTSGCNRWTWHKTANVCTTFAIKVAPLPADRLTHNDPNKISGPEGCRAPTSCQDWEVLAGYTCDYAKHFLLQPGTCNDSVKTCNPQTCCKVTNRQTDAGPKDLSPSPSDAWKAGGFVLPPQMVSFSGVANPAADKVFRPHLNTKLAGDGVDSGIYKKTTANYNLQ